MCPLNKKKNTKPEIFLVSIFIQDYYKNKPDDALWEEFPTPILVNSKGEKLGEIPALFPDESPGEMILTFGNWRDSVPGEIRMHIINPAVSGDYDLPILFWNQQLKRYLATAASIK